MLIQPLNDRILVRRIPEPKKSKIIVPDIAIQPSRMGLVLAVGPGKMVEGISGRMVRRPCEVRAGDIILFSGVWNDQDQDNTDAQEVLITEGDIFGVVKKPGPGRNTDYSETMPAVNV